MNDAQADGRLGVSKDNDGGADLLGCKGQKKNLVLLHRAHNASRLAKTISDHYAAKGTLTHSTVGTRMDLLIRHRLPPSRDIAARQPNRYGNMGESNYDHIQVSADSLPHCHLRIVSTVYPLRSSESRLRLTAGNAKQIAIGLAGERSPMMLPCR